MGILMQQQQRITNQMKEAHEGHRKHIKNPTEMRRNRTKNKVHEYKNTCNMKRFKLWRVETTPENKEREKKIK